jgi:photosystem II stability/assembly factor-like uncharacterized protein
MRVTSVQLHPTGVLFAMITALCKNKTFLEAGVGLYRSGDGGENWEKVNQSKTFAWPKDFTVDPSDANVIYLGAADASAAREGGLYRTTDGGKNWERLARNGPEHFGAYLDPRRKNRIYMTLTEGAPDAGLFASDDNGKTFNPIDGLPFSNIQRVEFDPNDERSIYVTTFGGSVWKGTTQ